MKLGTNAIRITVLLLVSLAALPAEADKGGLRYTITVSQFEDRSAYPGANDLGDAWGAVLTDVLQQTERFIVLGETDMRNEALGEQDFASSGRTVQGSKTPVKGQMTPAQLLVKGAITHYELLKGGGSGGFRFKKLSLGGKKESCEINVTVYLVDSTTGQVVGSTSVVGRSDTKGGDVGYQGYDWSGNLGGFAKDNVGKAIQNAVAQGVDWIIGQLPDVPWRGAVAFIKDDRIYVNRGAREGVAAGQTFLVGEAEVIRDPDTGEILDESLAEVARLEVATVKDKLSICEVRHGDASQISRGMAVHLPQE
jgi:curli biogenesis system outer membrane secretion channel CsgG